MAFDRYRERVKTMFNKKKIINFLDKQGFYIVLFICISIIGVTALLTSGGEVKPQDGVDGDMPPIEEITDEDIADDSGSDKHDINDIDIKIKDVLPGTNTNEEQLNTPVSESSGHKPTEISDSESGSEKQISKEVSQEIKDQQEKENGGDKKLESKEDNEDVKPVASQSGSSRLKMVYPVEGEVLKEYHMDDLVYSNTLKEWTTHPAMDIESFLGAEVKAAMAGVVEKIEEDPLMGIVITLDHGNGVKTRYANLSTANMVTKGQRVESGQVISGIGRTAGAEILDAPHLHFELIVNEKYVNPAEYLK